MDYLLSYKRNGKWFDYEGSDNYYELEEDFLKKDIYCDSYVIKEVTKYVNKPYYNKEIVTLRSTRKLDFFRWNNKIVYTINNKDLLEQIAYDSYPSERFYERYFQINEVNFNDFIELSAININKYFPNIDDIVDQVN